MTPTDAAIFALAAEFRQDGTVLSAVEVASLHAEACSGGYAPSCRAVAWAGQDGAWAHADYARALVVLGPVCDGSDGVACLVVAWSHVANSDYPAANAALDRACAAGTSRACGERAIGIAFGWGVPADPAGALPEIARACDAGVGNACLIAGDIATGSMGGLADPASAVALYTRGCDLGDAGSCDHRAGMLLAGTGVPVDRASAQVDYERACQQGYASSCAPLGDLEREGGAIEAARAAYAVGCERYDATACARAAALEAAVPVDFGAAPEGVEPPGFEAWLPSAIVPVVLGLAGATVIYRYLKNKRSDEAWHKAARDAGLASSGYYPQVSIDGTLAGVPVSLSQNVVIRGSGKNQRREVHVSASATIPRKMPAVVVTEEGWISMFSTWIGYQDITTGDSTFDAKFVVRCEDVDAAKLALGPATRRALLETRGQIGNVNLDGDRVLYHAHGAIDVKRALDILLGLSTCAVTIGVA